MKTFTFHVSAPGTGRVWRKIEIPAEATLDDLHWAIQAAYDFDGDHLYSFFMSGRAWDRATEYCLPEDVDPWDFFDDDELAEEDLDGEEGEPEEAVGLADESLPILDDETVENLQKAAGGTQPQSFEEMLGMVESNPQLRAEIARLMTEETGIPQSLAEMVLQNASALFSMAAPDFVSDLPWDQPEPGDVRTAVLDALGLEVGKTFMYLFDYGDEWRFKVRVHAIAEDADPEAEYPRIVEEVGQAPLQYGFWEDEEDWDEDEEDWDEEEEEDA